MYTTGQRGCFVCGSHVWGRLLGMWTVGWGGSRATGSQVQVGEPAKHGNDNRGGAAGYVDHMSGGEAPPWHLGCCWSPSLCCVLASCLPYHTLRTLSAYDVQRQACRHARRWAATGPHHLKHPAIPHSWQQQQRRRSAGPAHRLCFHIRAGGGRRQPRR